MMGVADDPAGQRLPAPTGDSPLAREGVLRAIDQLIDQCRVESLWYVRPDYYPRTDPERQQILEAIQERSTRDVFQRAGVLRAWLSRHSSDESASS